MTSPSRVPPRWLLALVISIAAVLAAIIVATVVYANWFRDEPPCSCTPPPMPCACDIRSPTSSTVSPT